MTPISILIASMIIASGGVLELGRRAAKKARIMEGGEA